MRLLLILTAFAVVILNGSGIGAQVEDLSPGGRAESRNPNIIVILADDLGYGDLSCYNAESKISTPNIDALAASGVRFTDAHSGWASCIPSRYALLTGRFGVRMQGGPSLIPSEQMTVASLLREQGYVTAMVGKWHLGFDKPPQEFDYEGLFSDGPVDRGFDSFFGMHASLDIQPYFYMRDRRAIEAPSGRIEARTSVGGDEDWNNIQGEFWREGDIAPDFVHAEVTPRFFEESVRVIADHGIQEAESPLFLYVALPSPHTPWLPTEEFRGRSGAGMYGDFVMQVDDGVGRILSALNESGMRENTVVMFSSDNGPVWYDKDAARFGHRSNGRLRGMKFSSHEGGHRMPFIVRWPRSVPAGGVVEQTIVFSDVMATFAEMSGAATLLDDVEHDGTSFLPYLHDPSLAPGERPAIVHDRWTIRDGDWKLIAPRQRRGRREESRGELYNLRDDIGEENNLFESRPDIVERLGRKLAEIVN
ncbi:MAG: arylsulfatase [Planctomycetota bacterium]